MLLPALEQLRVVVQDTNPRLAHLRQRGERA